MTSNRVEWYGEDRLREFAAAAEVGLDEAASNFVNEVKTTLRKTTGVIKGKTKSGRNIYTASMPGTPPGWRTGRLAGSIVSGRSGSLRRRIGTNLEYARIHETGGTINHPGGTYYGIGAGGRAYFMSETKAAQVRQRGGFLGRTKAHAINMPKRPYLVPTLARTKADGSIDKWFGGAFKRALRSGGVA